jgi:penicillin-binding protein 1A
LVTLFIVALPAAAFLPAATMIPGAIGWVHRGLAPFTVPLTLPRLPERSTIYAADGSVLAEVYKGFDRQAVPLHRINRGTRRAVLAVEDHAFYQHGPLDLEAIIRAALVDLHEGRIVQGGSTITQQLAKDLFTGDAVTLRRKLEEATDALRLGRTYSRSQILRAYLNEVFLGHSVYGVAAAAQYYFGVPVQDMTLSQSADLAGMLAAPNRFDPIAHPNRSLARRDFVLGRMRQLGWIRQSRFAHAASRPLGLSDRMRDLAAAGGNSWWTQFVIAEFLSDPRFGATERARAHALFRGGLRIHTTLDPRLQAAAQRAIDIRMGGDGLPQSALVSVVPSTGAITAMALGRWPFAHHRYDLAVDPGGGRTAGSSFKVFTLAAALEQGIPPSRVYDGSSPKTIPNCGGGETWTVHNAEPGSGSYPLWLATVDSVNAVFAQVIDEVGPDAVARIAHRMGVTGPLMPVCPLTLGTSPVSPLDMTSGVSTLANGGRHCDPYAIARVVYPNGKVLAPRPECRRAVPAAVAAEETAILEDVIGFGTGWQANIGRPAAGKTGTGQDYQDAWFVGYVPQLATGVWVGYAGAETPMPAVPGYGRGFGGVLAAPIWHDYMLAATRGMPVRGFGPAPIPLAGPSPPSNTTTTPTAHP